MKKLLFLIFPVSIFLHSCEPSSNSSRDQSLVMDQSIIQEMEVELFELNDEIIHLKDHFEFLLANRDSLLQIPTQNEYSFDQGYSTNTPQDSKKLSSVVVLNTSKDFEKSMENVMLTNSMDSLFRQTFEKYSMLAQVYYNTADQVSRVFPAYDAKTLLDPDVDLTNFNFYYEGDLEHNPEKGPVWIPEVYVDPAGRGWILSLVHPVYDGEELYAVLGLDITVDELIGRYLDNREGEFLIVNNKGDIVGGKSAAIESLSFPPLKHHVYRETILADNFRISDFNLFNSKNNEVRSMAQVFVMEKESHFSFTDDFSPKAAYAVPFTLLDWYLIELELRP
ncbi:Cache sensor protein [uncultured Algoriphagus sp.]|uniref:Cache sensor protein n=1 Tax=uncultured Algoriphagus sp. TaxID=417365 RepID=UPI0030EE5AC3